MSKAIRLMKAGLIDLEKIISHRFPLTEIDKAMNTLEQDSANPAVIGKVTDKDRVVEIEYRNKKMILS